METLATWLQVEPILLAGLAIWTSLAALNNVRAFAHGAAYIGSIMGMGRLRIEGVPDTPLMQRAVKNNSRHRLVLFVIVLAEMMTAIGLWGAALMYCLPVPPFDPYVVSYISLALFMGLGFLLLLGGSWFAYYAHMEQAQITHFLMITLAVAALCLLRLAA
jgi:predicted small integral membrane protein